MSFDDVIPADQEKPSVDEEKKTVDGLVLRTLVESSLTWLKTNQQVVNALNVFPVPDGDTGTNMVLTMQAAINEIAVLGERNIGKMAHAIAQGALMGARGNSGVILSQLWRGFARALDSLETMDAATFVRALGESRNTAYKGVVRPVEGTILTVAKDIATAGELSLAKGSDLDEILDAIIQAADASVKKTPDLLPILKQAGVVDAGGKGLFYILEGMSRYLKNQSLDIALASVQPLSAMNLENVAESIEPGQDFEIVLDFKPFQTLDLEEYYAGLSQIGTSIQVGEGDGIFRMHIHVPTEKRYRPIDYTMGLGTITKVSIENLNDQIERKELSQPVTYNLAKVEPGQTAVVVVSPGPGLSRIFASLGVNAIIEGGQTMNPSTEEILRAFENLPTDKIIILPNNKNIIMAANAVINITVKKVIVIPSFSIPQGLSAMLRFSPDSDLDYIAGEMTKAIKEVESGEITISTRNVEIDNIRVQKDQVIALLNDKLVYSASTIEDALLGLLEKANTNDHERITLFHGANISQNEVNRIADILRATYPSIEIEIHEGGQPFYQFIVSIE
jgi:uncharacterized protein